MNVIDLNCDLGEGFGIYTLGEDERLLDVISSANVACGFHGGDASTMHRVVAQCVERGVAIGAHPGLQDMQGFGRREMAIQPKEVYDLILYQIGALEAFVRTEGGGRLHHVKPHGALYNMAARDSELAQSIVQAIHCFDPQLYVYGLAGSELIRAARETGLPYVEEAFVDRGYRSNGMLLPRTEAGAVIDSAEKAVSQGVLLAKEHKVCAVDGTVLLLQAGTLCVHGDGKEAFQLLQLLRLRLKEAGVEIASPRS